MGTVGVLQVRVLPFYLFLSSGEGFGGGVGGPVNRYLGVRCVALTAADDVNTIIYAAMQPAPGGEKDLDSWYREEHNEQMSREQGYKRTTRYRPLFQTRNSGKDKPGGLDFVAFHQFREGNKVGAEVEPLDPMTEWTRRCMAGCEEIDAAVYRKVKTLTG